MSGDVFRNIGAGAVIINRSALSHAMNAAGRTGGTETAAAIEQIARYIEESGSAEAAENFNAFNEELRRPSPRKSLLKWLWNGVVAALPAVASLADATARIAALVH